MFLEEKGEGGREGFGDAVGEEDGFGGEGGWRPGVDEMWGIVEDGRDAGDGVGGGWLV